MIALLIFGAILFLLGLVLMIILDDANGRGPCILPLMIGFCMIAGYIDYVGYKNGQIDYAKGIIKYEQVIKCDTTYIKLY